MKLIYSLTFKSIVKLTLIPFVVCSISSVAFAAPCDDNFNVSGNFLTGKTYKVQVNLPNIKSESAWQAAYNYTIQDGWRVTFADKVQGAIVSTNAKSSRIVPMNILVQRVAEGTSIFMNYTTPAGVSSPDDAVRSHFCKTIAAAYSAVFEPVQTAATQPTSPPTSPSPISKPSAVGNPNLAAITPDQITKLEAAIIKPVSDAKLAAMIAEASPVISEVISKLACLKSYSNTLFPRYFVPGDNGGVLAPMGNLKYHNNTLCLTVERFQAWQARALNALTFQVLYIAEDSGESVTRDYTVIKQPDGLWLFKQF